MGNYNRKNNLDNTFYVGMDVHKNSISLKGEKDRNEKYGGKFKF